MSRMDHEEREERREFIKSLSPAEADVYADMVMRSLRGSWRSPRRRAHILEYIGRFCDMNSYDADEIESRAGSYFEKIGRGSPDGRYWRRIYQESDVSVTELPRQRVNEFASRIPDDMTWDDYRIRKEFNDD